MVALRGSVFVVHGSPLSLLSDVYVTLQRENAAGCERDEELAAWLEDSAARSLLTSTPSAVKRRKLACAAELAGAASVLGAETVLEGVGVGVGGSDLARFQATDSNISVTEASKGRSFIKGFPSFDPLHLSQLRHLSVRRSASARALSALSSEERRSDAIAQSTAT